jgi:hypothetical protein
MGVVLRSSGEAVSMGDPSDAESIASEPDRGSLVRKERRRRWQEDNRLAIASYNERLKERVSTADEHDPF